MKRTGLALLGLAAACASSGQNGQEADPPPAAATTAAAVQVPYTEGNGAVVSLPIEGTAAVAVKVQFYTGSVDDPPTKEGLTALTARLIAEGGTESMTYPELLKALYPMSAQISAQVDKEQTTFSVLVHKDHVEKLAPILAEVLTRPKLGESDLARLRSDMLNDLRKRLRASDDENLGKEILNQLLYPAGHPYHHPVIGTVQGLEAISAEDVRQHYTRVFGKKRLVIGLAGAVDENVRTALEKALSALPDGEPRLKDIPPPAPITETEVLIAKKPATKAVAISAGAHHDAFRGHPDFPALALVQSYFGEHRQFHGILMSEMREKRGLNYGDYAYVENFIQEGWSRDVRTNIARRRQHFEIWIRPVDPKDTLFSLRLALFLREQLVRDGITPLGLTQTQQFLAGYTRLWELTPMRRLGYALDSRFYGIEGSWLDEYRARLEKLTKAEVDQAIQRHLAKPLRIAIVAEDAEGLKAALLEGAPSSKEYGAQVDPQVLEVDKQLAAMPLGLSESQVKIVPVEELFER